MMKPIEAALSGSPLRALLGAALLMALASCSSVPNIFGAKTAAMTRVYVDPQGGERAQLRMSVDGSGANGRVYPANSCPRWQEPRSGWVMTSVFGIPLFGTAHTGRSLGTRGAMEAKGLISGEVYLRANELVTLAYDMGTSDGHYNYGCLAGVAFTPVANHHYHAIARWVGRQQCAVMLFDVDEQGVAKPVQATPANLCEAVGKQ